MVKNTKAQMPLQRQLLINRYTDRRDMNFIY